MAKAENRGAGGDGPGKPNPFRLKKAGGTSQQGGTLTHVIKKGVLCATEKRGRATPRGSSPAKIVVDASDGFIPLWAEGTTLRWRFQERSFDRFESPEAAKGYVEQLFGEAVLAWGDARPINFAKREDAWDFEIVMSGSDDCEGGGCVLASAFFPDAGQHELWLYPKMFEDIRAEQIETLVHEVGHIFGLRHFFADITETEWRSEIFGEHKPFSIMNYGEESRLTESDRSDLRRLYQLVWSGELTEINGTPVQLVRPFHTLGGDQDALAAIGRRQAAIVRPSHMAPCNIYVTVGAEGLESDAALRPTARPSGPRGVPPRAVARRSRRALTAAASSCTLTAKQVGDLVLEFLRDVDPGDPTIKFTTTWATMGIDSDLAKELFYDNIAAFIENRHPACRVSDELVGPVDVASAKDMGAVRDVFLKGLGLA